MFLLKVIFIFGWVGFLVCIRCCVSLYHKLRDERKLKYLWMVLYFELKEHYDKSKVNEGG